MVFGAIFLAGGVGIGLQGEVGILLSLGGAIFIALASVLTAAIDRTQVVPLRMGYVIGTSRVERRAWQQVIVERIGRGERI